MAGFYLRTVTRVAKRQLTKLLALRSSVVVVPTSIDEDEQSNGQLEPARAVSAQRWPTCTGEVKVGQASNHVRVYNCYAHRERRYVLG